MPNTPYKIINLGDVGWTDLNDAFKNNTALEAVTIGAGINQLTEMINTFNGCYNLTEINVVDWDIGNITSLRNFLKGCKLNSSSYSSMLVHFADSTTVNVGVIFHGGDSFFNDNAQSARDTLVNVYQWIIEDGGLQPVWNQILSTDSEGALFDLTSNISVPEFTNKRCVEFFGQDYVNANTLVSNIDATNLSDEFHISFDMEIYNLNNQYIMGDCDWAGDYIGHAIVIYNGALAIEVAPASTENMRFSEFNASELIIGLNSIEIYKTNGDANVYIKINNNLVVVNKSVFSYYGQTDYISYHIGKQPKSINPTYFTGKLSNVHIQDKLFFPLEEKYGSDCCNTVISDLGILNGEIIAQSDVGLMRTSFAVSSPEPSYEWKHGYNKIDEFTSAPSLYNKSLASFKIDSNETYAVATANMTYSWNRPVDEVLLRFNCRILDNQPQSNGLIATLGNKHADERFMSIRYNGAGVYLHSSTNNDETDMSTDVINISKNTEYVIEIYVVFRSFATDIYAGLKVYNTSGTLIGQASKNWYFAGTSFYKTYANLYFGQPPIAAALNLPQDSCLCNITYCIIDNTSNGLGDLLYTDQLLGTYVINDLEGDNDMNIIPRYEIGDCWSRSKDEQQGIYVDCIEYQPVLYPPCKDGILHNGADCDFIYTSAELIETIYLTEDVGDILMGNYIKTGEYSSKPYYKHEVNGHYIYYASSMWRIDSILGSVDTTNIVSNADTMYPPNLPWYLATDLLNPITLEAQYISYPINTNGTMKEISYSDLLTTVRDDGAIVEKHITDDGVTVIDKLQLIKE